MLFSAIRAGASGYILKQIGSNDLVKALEAVSRGEALLDPAVTQRVFQEVRRAVKEEEASAFQQDQPRDRQTAFPGRGNGPQLCLEHPLETGGEQPGRGGCLRRGAQPARIHHHVGARNV